MNRVIATIVAVAMLLASVGAAGYLLLSSDVLDFSSDDANAEPAQIDRGEADQSDTAPSADLTEFYAQDLNWEQCKNLESADCASLTVPVDYTDPSGKTIEIETLRIPAQKPDEWQGSLVVNPGGPGGSGIDYALNARYAFGQPLRDHFDIVGFDPRGVGRSAPVDCLSDEALDEYIAGDATPDDDTPVAEIRESNRDFAAGCKELSPDLVEHVSTQDVARDMDVLRAAMGNDQLDYFGASYGTSIGATYAELFPENVGKFVLDAATDPDVSALDASLQQAEGFETALRAYVQNCVDSNDCFLGDSVEQGLTKIKNLMNDIEEEPLETGTDRKLRIGNAFYGMIIPLYQRSAWSQLSLALKSAFQGEGRPLLLLSDIYASRDQDGGYTDNSMEAIGVINCLDDPVTFTPDQVEKVLPRFEQASPTFAGFFAWGMMGCEGFDPSASPEPLDIKGEGANPIIVTGTTRDPATPFRWAKNMANSLESGVLIERDGDGHGAYNAGNECVDEAIEGYLINDEVPEDGLKC